MLCDILPMDAYHLLFRSPWQFNKGVMQNGTTNTYTFNIKCRNYTLTSLPLNQIQNVKPSYRKGNTSNKALFLSKTWVERSISKGKPVYALC